MYTDYKKKNNKKKQKLIFKHIKMILQKVPANVSEKRFLMTIVVSHIVHLFTD